MSIFLSELRALFARHNVHLPPHIEQQITQLAPAVVPHADPADLIGTLPPDEIDYISIHGDAVFLKATHDATYEPRRYSPEVLQQYLRPGSQPYIDNTNNCKEDETAIRSGGLIGAVMRDQNDNPLPGEFRMGSPFNAVGAGARYNTFEAVVARINELEGTNTNPGGDGSGFSPYKP